jgi:DinB family protein
VREVRAQEEEGLMEIPKALFDQAARALLVECFEGPPGRGTWVISHAPDAALLPLLDRIDAAAASRRKAGHPSIAAHVNHLRFSLSLANRWASGEDPYADANWASSWSVQEVGAAEWEDLRSEIRTEYERWREAVSEERAWDEMAVTGIMASIAHALYHLGAVRQLHEAGHGT